MRAFISIDLPYKINKELSIIQDKFASLKNLAGMDIVKVENIHLTLKFLGEISNSEINRLSELLNETDFEKFELELEDLDYFPTKEYPRIVWLSLKPKKDIEKLYTLVDEKLKQAKIFSKIGKEDKFVPHVTVARVKYIRDKNKFAENLKKISIKKQKFEVSSFQLKKSTLTSKGPIYETLREFELK